ncbi:TetR/AcrR family transcriptional regulator [Serratia inhibens]|uniref:TetR/AcrR family transcriptional regulator n=2 Tax=Serratia inhibens TaxID=2338073 RepID=A0AA92X9P8_9GAMM|nr:TetR/AcrR family transcriptional regulator [Serratia inhibens]
MSSLSTTKEMLQRLDAYLTSFEWENITKSKLSILQAFLKLATKNGYDAVTMRSLAKAVNLKPPSIYSHFPDGKDQIVSSALRWHYYSFAIAVKEGLSQSQTKSEYWSALIRVHITQQIKNPENDLFDMLMSTDRLGGILPYELRSEMLEWLAFCDFMYESIATDFGIEDANQKGVLIRVTLDGANSWWKWDGSEENLEQCIQYAEKIATGILKIS